MNKEYFQFNLDFRGNYIKGYWEGEYNNYIKISEPQFSFSANNPNPKDNIIFLSKQHIICYFKIEK